MVLDIFILYFSPDANVVNFQNFQCLLFSDRKTELL